MLSEGTLGIDNTYFLKEGTVHTTVSFGQLLIRLPGILTLHIDKESYERAGIVGKPDGVKGKRGTKPRWGELV